MALPIMNGPSGEIEALLCPRCGEWLAADEAFCPTCGKQIDYSQFV